MAGQPRGGYGQGQALPLQISAARAFCIRPSYQDERYSNYYVEHIVDARPSEILFREQVEKAAQCLV